MRVWAFALPCLLPAPLPTGRPLFIFSQTFPRKNSDPPATTPTSSSTFFGHCLYFSAKYLPTRQNYALAPSTFCPPSIFFFQTHYLLQFSNQLLNMERYNNYIQTKSNTIWGYFPSHLKLVHLFTVLIVCIFQPNKGSKKAKKSGSNIFSLFSQKQIQEFKEAFGIIDCDKDGIITAPDLKKAFEV